MMRQKMIQQTVERLFEKIVGHPVNVQDTFVDLGIDSLDLTVITFDLAASFPEYHAKISRYQKVDDVVQDIISCYRRY